MKLIILFSLICYGTFGVLGLGIKLRPLLGLGIKLGTILGTHGEDENTLSTVTDDLQEVIYDIGGFGLGGNIGPHLNISEIIDPMFSTFAKKYSKVYGTTEEDDTAKQHVLNHLKTIVAHNAKNAAGEVDYTMCLYDFHDVSNNESIAFLCGAILPPTTRALPSSDSTADSFPDGPDALNFTDYCLPVVDQNVSIFFLNVFR